MTPVRTVFLGSGAFGLPALRSLPGRADVDLVGVVTAPPRPAGRRGEPRPTDVERLARAAGLRVLAPERLRAPESVAAVLELRPELVVLADYGQIVPAALLDLPHGALNLHPSLLPRHRGASPVPAVILAGDAETGVTLMRMDAGLDTGPIIAVRRIQLDGSETGPDLLDRLASVAADLLEASLGPWLRGELRPSPQAPDGATLTRPLRRDDGRLDPDRPAVALERQVRALAGWPGTFLETDRGRLIVHAAAVGEGGGEPGSIVADGDGLALVTARGRLRLLRVQPPGGRPMTAAEYRRGLHDDLPTRAQA